jgi:hypothetical protein
MRAMGEYNGKVEEIEVEDIQEGSETWTWVYPIIMVILSWVSIWLIFK